MNSKVSWRKDWTWDGLTHEHVKWRQHDTASRAPDLTALWPWAAHLTCWKLFPICKTGITVDDSGDGRHFLKAFYVPVTLLCIKHYFIGFSAHLLICHFMRQRQNYRQSRTQHSHLMCLTPSPQAVCYPGLVPESQPTFKGKRYSCGWSYFDLLCSASFLGLLFLFLLDSSIIVMHTCVHT